MKKSLQEPELVTYSNLIIKKIIILIIALCYSIVSWATCSEQIKTFYSTYMRNILCGNSYKNKELCKTYMDQVLRLKIQRISYVTGADAVIRAQDVSEDAIQSLSVESVGKNWYLVHYFFDIKNENTKTAIPLKVMNVGNTCQIVYITPIWNGNLYGDDLLSNVEPNLMAINQESERSFIESFYSCYLSPYINISDNLQSNLNILRSKYLTYRAISEFKSAEQNHFNDGMEGYDLLIDNFDFDYQWYRFFHISRLGNGYVVEYKSCNKVHRIIITLKKCNDNYYIDGISIYNSVKKNSDSAKTFRDKKHRIAISC